VIVALDGNFQLRRLKCAGNDIDDQLVKDRFIMKQKQFDEWIITHDSFWNKSNKNQVCKNCNYVCFYICIYFYFAFIYFIITIFYFKETACDSYFKAADQVRSNIKSKHLDDTGLFGSTCRHGVPLGFINLKGIGERLKI